MEPEAQVEYHEEFWEMGYIPLLNRKIFKGTRVTIREHPYVASIRRDTAHYTTAAILTKNTFITTAYPLNEVPISELSVVVGENYCDRGATLLTVMIVIFHEKFNPNNMANDLALVRIYQDVAFRGSIKSISLIERWPSKLEQITAFVTGWGRCDRTGLELCIPRSTKYTKGEILDPMLQTVKVTAVSSGFCQVYKNNDVNFFPGMICLGRAREEEPLVGCSAVPGAPLVMKGSLGGLLSWGYGCGYKYDLPLIYTNVKYYDLWLKHNIKIMESITSNELNELFEATRAYIMLKWLKLTQHDTSEDEDPEEERVNDLLVDRKLAELNGTSFDIRDYLYRGAYHEYKLELYRVLHQRLIRIEKIMEMSKQTVTASPFLKYNSSDYDYNHFNYSIYDSEELE